MGLQIFPIIYLVGYIFKLKIPHQQSNLKCWTSNPHISGTKKSKILYKNAWIIYVQTFVYFLTCVFFKSTTLKMLAQYTRSFWNVYKRIKSNYIFQAVVSKKSTQENSHKLTNAEEETVGSENAIADMPISELEVKNWIHDSAMYVSVLSELNFFGTADLQAEWNIFEK